MASLVQFSGGGAVIGPSYLRKKGENLATKEDMVAITRDVERGSIGIRGAPANSCTGEPFTSPTISGAVPLTGNLTEAELARSAFVLNALVLLEETGWKDVLWMGSHGNLLKTSVARLRHGERHLARLMSPEGLKVEVSMHQSSLRWEEEAATGSRI